MSDLISRSAVINLLCELHIDNIAVNDKRITEYVREIPTAYDVNKVVEAWKNKTEFLKNCTKYGNENLKQQEYSYSTMMIYEVADLVEDLLEIVKGGGVNEQS